MRLKTSPAPLSQVSVTSLPGRERPAFGRPYRLGGRNGGSARLRDPAEIGEVGMLAADRREQLHQRARRLDRLVIVGEQQIVDAPAGEVDRALERRRVDLDALLTARAPRRAARLPRPVRRRAACPTARSPRALPERPAANRPSASLQAFRPARASSSCCACSRREPLPLRLELRADDEDTASP